MMHVWLMDQNELHLEASSEEPADMNVSSNAKNHKRHLENIENILRLKKKTKRNKQEATGGRGFQREQIE